RKLERWFVFSANRSPMKSRWRSKAAAALQAGFAVMKVSAGWWIRRPEAPVLSLYRFVFFVMIRRALAVGQGAASARRLRVMVAPVGPPATISREPGQARKGAATAADLGAGV